MSSDPANVPRPENIDARRRYINQYIQRFYSDLVPQIEEARKAAFLLVCRKYHEERHIIGAPAAYFEYAIDKTLWRNMFLHLYRQAPAWPWNKGPDMDDTSAGMSRAYREWRIEKGLPVNVSPQADQQPPRDLELLLANARQEIERLNVHLRDVKTLHQESKEAMQGWLNEKDALLGLKDQEIQRLRMESRNSGGQRQRLTSANRRTQSLGMQLAAAKEEATTQRRKLETANSRITHLENQLTESPGVQALETQLARANTRASNAEDESRHQGHLHDANTQLAGIQTQPPG
ncbi:hypothetical protein F25303_10322 [Fusarium sp. NRRL 25303]|nr:hypothetical protein F25303_10322 [Fusarium sp. NRRL 25303]